MKIRSICIAALALALPAIASTQAHADGVYVGQMRFDGLLAGDGTGGEFAWTNQTLTFTPQGQGDASRGLGASQFITFCVEVPEHISPGQSAHAFLNTRSENTYVDLRAETAFLYTQFIKGALPSYTYNDNAAATSLQKAIWVLQGQIASVGGDTQAQAWLDLADDEVHLANGGTWGDTIGNVRILNIWSGLDSNGAGTGALQDQLVMIPLPAPVWMAGLGLVGVIGGSIYRRRSSRSLGEAL